MSVLSRDEIKKKMGKAKYEERLIVTPLLTEDQIREISIDVRLGCSIAVPRKTYIESHDVTDPNLATQAEQRLYEKIILRPRHKFVLHPNSLILAATFEYISLPCDISCIIASRSSWGRLGLVVATASVVQPGFKGSLTLELSNLSESPIVLFPGLPVGQLVFEQVEYKKEAPYEGRYDCPTQVGLPSFFAKGTIDDEMRFWSGRIKGDS